ncbi:hypothetical protein J3F83DRAFT_729131 [Trichoderma novae-zelandiae]
MRALAIQLSNPNDGSATSHPHRGPTTRIGTKAFRSRPRAKQQAAKWLSDKRSAEKRPNWRKQQKTASAGALNGKAEGSRKDGEPWQRLVGCT